MLNVEKADSLRSEMVKICAAITGHTPRELCTTAEAVEWLVGRHKAATAALYKLEEIRTEKLAVKGLAAEASAVSAARVILQSKRIAAESADGKPDGQAEIIEMMNVCHGGAHNDTICIAEKQEPRLL